jgi:hypothetical protein
VTKPTKTGPSQVHPENVQPITKDQLKDLDKYELEAHMKHYEELCLASYGQTKSGVFKKSPLPTPKQVTFSADPEGLQDMMIHANCCIPSTMHQCIIQWIGDSVEVMQGETSFIVAATEAQGWTYDRVSYISGKAWDTKYLKVFDFGLKPVQAVDSDDKD